MSGLLYYPVDLPGVTFKGRRKMGFYTLVGTGETGREFRVFGGQSIPLWAWDLSYDFVKQGLIGPDLRRGANELMAFLEVARGQWLDFLYRDPDDHGPIPSSSPQVIGVGDGTTNSFPIFRTLTGLYGSLTEPVWGPGGSQTPYSGDSAIVVYINGGVNPFNFNGHIVSFPGGPPSPGQVVSYSGVFYYKAHVNQDRSSFQEFMQNYWSTDVTVESSVDIP